MATPAFLRSLLDLAACDSLDDLLAAAARVLERELGVRGTIELWDGDDAPIVIGEHCAAAPHSTWIGIRYTIGAIHLDAIPAEPADVELLARQLAPLAERLIELEASRRRTIREDIDRLYERRIRDALIRRDWNASAVARELAVGRARIAEVARRWRRWSRGGDAGIRDGSPADSRATIARMSPGCVGRGTEHGPGSRPPESLEDRSFAEVASPDL